MRVFVDCTHTANYTYKNTGIHRVVRQLISELDEISKSDPNLKTIPVSFDGTFVRRVNSLAQNEPDEAVQTTGVEVSRNFRLARKIISKLKILRHKVANKTMKIMPLESIEKIRSLQRRAINKTIKVLHLNHLTQTLRRNKQDDFNTFEGIRFSTQDYYLIPDANWDLPKSYYNFLEQLRSYGVTIVLICHDLIPIKFPQFCSKDFSKAFTEYYVQYSPLCDKVIGVSRNSAQDYLDAKDKGIIPNSNQNQIVENFRLGGDYSKSDRLYVEDNGANDSQIKSLLDEQYILVVGSLSPHKNAKAVVTAFDMLTSHRDVHLIFAGNRGWHPETDILIESNAMYGKLIHILSSVTDSQLQLLYKNCYCLVQASFYEGFGLPVVEALQHYKPVISSTAGSLIEVGGDFCIYFDPNQPLELYQALKKLLDSDTYYNQLVTRIKTEYKPFSWRESAEQLLSLLRDQKRLE